MIHSVEHLHKWLSVISVYLENCRQIFSETKETTSNHIQVVHLHSLLVTHAIAEGLQTLQHVAKIQFTQMWSLMKDLIKLICEQFPWVSRVPDAITWLNGLCVFIPDKWHNSVTAGNSTKDNFNNQNLAQSRISQKKKKKKSQILETESSSSCSKNNLLCELI